MRPPLRYKLRWLLVAVTVCAIASATIWQFWPRYRAYQARARLEAAATQFGEGMSIDDIAEIIGHGAWNSSSSDATGAMVALSPYFLEGAWYCVYMELDSNAGKSICGEMPCKSVETYRLAVPPKSYSPQTQAGRDEVFPPAGVTTMRDTPQGLIEVRASPKQGDDAIRAAYIQDFYEHISRRSKADLGLSYEKLPRAATKKASAKR